LEDVVADASGALGGRQLAGTWVNRRGTAKKVVARAARSAVAQVELGGGKLACPLTITFGDGGRWEFDAPRGGRSAAQRVVSTLGG
jgi:hypothetical protein